MKRWTLVVAACLTLGCQITYAHSYPSVESIEDIHRLYLKTVEEITAKQEQVRLAFRKDVEEFLKLPVHKMKTERVLQIWDETVAHIEHAQSVFQLMGMVEPDDALRTRYAQAEQALREESIAKIAETPEIYQKLVELKAKEKKRATLSKESSYYLALLMEEMELQGMHLPAETRERVKKLNIEISELAQEFGKNIQEDHSSVVVACDALEGVSENILTTLPSPKEGYYLLTCDYPTYFAVMGSCHQEETRKSLYRAFHNRAYPQNIAVLEKLLAKQDARAQILGFKSAAHYQLALEMAKDPAEADQFLSDLAKEAAPKQESEVKVIKEVVPGVKMTSSNQIAPWDVLYAQQQVKEKLYDLNQEMIKEYFPLEKTIAGLIWVFENFFNLNTTRLPINGLWHEDVQLLKIEDRSTHKVYGYLLLDLFPRANKYSHACHGTLVAGIDLPGGESTTSLSIVLANFPKATGQKPSLLSFSDVKTFFHELGHGIHALMGRTQYVLTSGTHTKTDFVELPSQMLEEWLYEPEVLNKVSGHYVTGHPLPAEWVSKLQKARAQGTGQFVISQCFFSQLALHYFASGARKDTDAIRKQVYDTYPSLATYDPEVHQQASFGHLDEYGSRYYGYLWSRVFAADVFEQIKKEGLLNPEAGKRYLKEILSKGGSDDPAKLLRAYLGREPSRAPFLKMYGLKSTSV